MTAITFTVYGKAQPKGSTRAIPFQDRKTGRLRVNVMSDNKNLKSWERLVSFEARAALRQAGYQDQAPYFGNAAVAIGFRFGIVRPRSASQRRRPHPTVKPDLDKLMRAAVDGLIGVFVVDDAQVCKFINPEKFYVGSGERPCAEITVMEHVLP